MQKFVEFAGPKGILRGTMHVPAGKGKHPGVVILHGFSGSRMEASFLFVGLSRALETAGIASLRFDFWGSGESDGEFVDMTVSSERGDALAALDFFKSQPEVDASRLGLLGLSMGGFVAACTLGARSDVKAASLWSAAGAGWRERLEPKARQEIAQRGVCDRGGLQIDGRFLDDLARHHPFAEIAKYRGPVLVVHGTDDQAVPLDDAKAYVKALGARPMGRCEHFFVEGGGHVFSVWDHRLAVYDRTVKWFAQEL